MRHEGSVRRVLFILACAGACWLFGARSVLAQQERDLKLFRPLVDVSVEGIAKSDFDEGDGQYGSGNFSLTANLPLGPARVRMVDGAMTGHQYLALASLSRTEPTIDFVDRNVTLYSGSLSFAALALNRRGNLYIGALGASAAEDDKTVHSPDPRFYGLGLATYNKSSILTFVYGGAASYQYGRPLALPLFGVLWSPKARWTFGTLVPVWLWATLEKNDHFKITYLFGVTGDRYRFANEGQFPSTATRTIPDTVYFRVTQPRLGVEFEYHSSRDIALVAQTGIIGQWNLAFAEGNNENFETRTVKPAGYLKLGARFTFGKSLFDKAP